MLALNFLLASLLLTFTTAGTIPAINSSPRLHTRSTPQNSTCFCQQKAPEQYTINLWILDKTTSEDDSLSQGLRDNFDEFCKGYNAQFSNVVPIVTNQDSGDWYPASSAPATLGAHLYLGFADLQVSGYVLGLNLAGKAYDGCLTEVVEAAEKMNVTCPCSK